MSIRPLPSGDLPDRPGTGPSGFDPRAELLADVTCAELEASWALLRRSRAVYEADAHNRGVVAGLRSSARREVERRSFLAQLALTLRVPEARAHGVVAQARMLFGSLHATAAAVEEGAIGFSQALVIVEEAYSLPEEALATYDAQASELGAGRTCSQLRRRVRALRERLHPVSLEVRHSAAFESRSVWTDPGRDGMGTLTACLSNADLALIDARLDATARAMRFGPAADSVGDTSPAAARDGDSAPGPVFVPDPALAEAWAEARTIAQLRADVLRDILVTSDAASAESAGVPAVTTTVLLTVPVLTLLGRDDTPATMEGVGPIAPSTARRLVADAPGLTRILTHPETGAILSFGRDAYRVSAALRRYLRLRDGSCTFPGCNRKAAACDIDHADDWAHGGCTDAGNLAHLCRGHHTLKHHAGWHTEPPGDVRPHTPARRWRAPTSDVFERPPESALPGLDPPF